MTYATPGNEVSEFAVHSERMRGIVAVVLAALFSWTPILPLFASSDVLPPQWAASLCAAIDAFSFAGERREHGCPEVPVISAGCCAGARSELYALGVHRHLCRTRQLPGNFRTSRSRIPHFVPPRPAKARPSRFPPCLAACPGRFQTGSGLPDSYQCISDQDTLPGVFDSL